MNIGDRVGALMSDDITETGRVVSLFGYGVYDGDREVVLSVEGEIASTIRQAKIKNPNIKLDNGKMVYGFECWWGPEVEIKKHVEHALSIGAKVVVVDVEEWRKQVG